MLYGFFIVFFGMIEAAGCIGFLAGCAFLTIGEPVSGAAVVMVAGLMIMATGGYIKSVVRQDHEAEQASLARLLSAPNERCLFTLGALYKYGYEFMIHDGRITAVVKRRGRR